MSTAIATIDADKRLQIGKEDEELLFAAVAEGNLAKLTSAQKLSYYARRCRDLGLNPMNQPFSWLTLNGKLVLYANRSCTEELRSTRKISVSITAREMHGDCYVVSARATMPDGRFDESTGAVPLPEMLKGEAKANAMMKAETKAKRRVTLSICGLGVLDETEVVTIPEVQKHLERAAQEEYELQHAAIIEKAEAQHAEEAQNSTENTPQVEPPAPLYIDETTQRKLVAAAREKNVSRDDLKQYLKDTHGIDTLAKITGPILGDLIKWLESVQA